MFQKLPEDSQASRVFRQGDLSLLIDRKGRRYMLRLEQGKSFHSHIGTLPHSEIIGREHGCRVVTSGGQRLLAIKPTMADFILEMPRIAQVIYPKDVGAIVTYGDIFPGAHVLEAGTGSGALTIALLRAVGENGYITSYDVRPDMMERAEKNIHSFVPGCDNLVLKLGDVYERFEERDLDRVILDLPEPWQVVPLAAEALVPGGIFLSFLP
ncbi:MAG: methyltransferase domain-containing protein, partial [Chloroflexi bacterium]|nr:methyltransferase domain-containing protein [Chloroflexota bacterium]